MVEYVSYAHFMLKARREVGGQINLDIAGTSMQPIIRQGDRVAIRPVDAGLIMPGDVFAFWEGGRVVVHRCVGKRNLHDGWHLCQKGDNLLGWSWLQEDRVVGKVERIMKPERVLDLSDSFWTCFNGTLGFFVSISILLAEKTASSDAVDRARRTVPGFEALAVGVSKALRTLCSLSVNATLMVF